MLAIHFRRVNPKKTTNSPHKCSRIVLGFRKKSTNPLPPYGGFPDVTKVINLKTNTVVVNPSPAEYQITKPIEVDVGGLIIQKDEPPPPFSLSLQKERERERREIQFQGCAVMMVRNTRVRRVRTG